MPKILLIDDSAALLEHIAHLLSELGHDVTPTANGTEALRRLRVDPVDLVVTDLCMPPPDGFEIIAALRRLDRRVPFVVMSTLGYSCEMFRAARTMGAAATLEKPFDRAQLEAAVAAALTEPGLGSFRAPSAPASISRSSLL